MRGPTVTERERRDLQERAYRDTLRDIGQIAREGIRGHRRRESALMDIDRLAARALQEAA